MEKTLLFLYLLTPFFFACSTHSQNQTSEERTEPVEMQRRSVDPIYQQIILVQTPDWDSVQGTLSRWQWEENSWKKAGEDWSIVVGKSGMAWGKGMKAVDESSGPVKREGDKRSPAGVFKLGAAFGYAEQPTWVQTPYIQVLPSTMCIEDGNSAYYNQIIDEALEVADWNSTDHMLRKDDLYEWGVFVAHNSPEAESGKGSCIFLHVWRKEDSGTAGCTAMKKENMKTLIRWLDPARSPVLIQMPSGSQEFRKELEALHLPIN